VHAVHFDDFALETCPTPQSVHLADFSKEYFPAGQSLQDKWSLVFVPAGQFVHFVAPAFDHVPIGHS
jgi:hypothetical protein